MARLFLQKELYFCSCVIGERKGLLQAKEKATKERIRRADALFCGLDW